MRERERENEDKENRAGHGVSQEEDATCSVSLGAGLGLRMSRRNAGHEEPPAQQEASRQLILPCPQLASGCGEGEASIGNK